MKFIPHDYQQYAIQFLEKESITALILDMGLGKTVITLTAINSLIHDSFDVQKVLVVAPLRVARDTWAEEIRKWEHLSDLRFEIAVGTESERRGALRRKADIHIINRENIDWLVNKSNIPWAWDMLVIDELSSFKSWQSQRFKALWSVRSKVKRVVGLTGTPSGNGLMDLFAEYKLLDGGKRLGRYIGRYREAYFVPDKRNGMQIFSYKPRVGAEEEIYAKIDDITISMKSTDHLQMPEILNNEVVVRLSDKEKKQYDTLKRDMLLSVKDGEIDAVNAAALCGKLCQLANGAVYDENNKVIHIHDRKLDALEDLIEAANGKSVLIAYWFKHDYERIKAKFDVVKLDTADSIKKWNNSEIPIAVIHPASAGHGLNLQSGGSTLIWFGLTWSLELYQQTNARLWRQGQKAETVVVHHIIAKGTIDEQIMTALREKDKTQADLIAAVKAEM
ncbi:DEAD/DEAH box helicase [Clostridia bacterium]|nr:DEAD/DEAH box helicase [Clostridia bacterium]